MGTFMGHMLPGLILALFAFWFMVQSFRRYFYSQQRNSRFTSTVTFQCDCLCGRLKEWPVEAVFKIVFSTVVIVGELATGIRQGHLILPNAQHATIISFFALAGVIDILVFYRAALPPDIDYVSNILAFVIEYFVFSFHSHGHSQLEVLLHSFLLYTVAANAVALGMEMKYRHSLLAVLARSYFLLLQGTWLWQLGFILHNPLSGADPWKQNDQQELMIATLYFAWHCAVNFILILLIGAAIACCYRRQSGYVQDKDMSMKRLIHTGANGQTLVALNDDSDLDSDVEFQKPAR